MSSDDDLMPKNFYTQPKQLDQNKYTTKPPKINHVPDNADANLPENFYKFRPGHVSVGKSSGGTSTTNSSMSESMSSAHAQLGLSYEGKPSGQILTSKPSNLDTFEIERRLKVLMADNKKANKPVKTSDIEARLDKLKGHDKPPPSIEDIKIRLKNLAPSVSEDPGIAENNSEIETSKSRNHHPTDHSKLSPKKRKIAPLITVMSLNNATTPEDLVEQVQKELGIDPEKIRQDRENYEKLIRRDSEDNVSTKKPVADMTPEELLAFVNHENFDTKSESSERSFTASFENSDGERDSDDSLVSDDDRKELNAYKKKKTHINHNKDNNNDTGAGHSSDNTHDSIGSDMMTDDESNSYNLKKKTKVSRKEWRDVIRDLIRSEKAEKDSKKTVE